MRAVLLFGLPASRTRVGSEAYDDEGIVQRAVHADRRPSLRVMTDVCLCEYTRTTGTAASWTARRS